MRRIALIVLAVVSVGMTAILCLDPPAAGPLAAAAAIAMPLALIVLGATSPGSARSGSTLLTLVAALGLIYAASFATLFLLTGNQHLWLGVPLSAWVLLAGMLVLPLVVSSLGYALTFERLGIATADLEMLRRLARGQAGGPAGASQGEDDGRCSESTDPG